MEKNVLEQEKDAIDFVTGSMFSLCFLESISDTIFSPQRDSLTVGQFYDSWFQKTGARDAKIPYNLGAILGYLYCGILLTKENWYNLLPNTDLNKSDPKWGLTGTTCVTPKESKPNIKYVARRIRNALSHGNIHVSVPSGLDRSEFMTRVNLYLYDRDKNDPNNTFDISLNLGQLYNFIKAFHSIIHTHVRSKTV